VNRAIYLLDAGNQLVEMREQAYDSEDLLQRLLATHPRLLAGDQIGLDSPRRWLLVTREMPVPGEASLGGRFSVDHLFLDQDGVPTLVEVKRSTDTRVRREVVGQMLDYAANAVVYWPIEHLMSRFEATCRTRSADPDEVLAEHIGELDDPADFWQRTRTNLQAGRIRMIFVADVIPPELKRIIEFLNGQMSPAEVLGIEVRKYAGGDLRTLVPTLIGQTAEAEQRKGIPSSQRRKWDEESFFAEVTRHVPEHERGVRELLDWARGVDGEISWGSGIHRGTYSVVFPDLHRRSVITVYTTGELALNFKWLRDTPPGGRVRRQSRSRTRRGTRNRSSRGLPGSLPHGAARALDASLEGPGERARHRASHVRTNG
jgi:hypothetical protein